MIKKLLLFALVAVAALKFAGVRPADLKHRIDSLSQSSARSMMGGDQDGN